MKSFLEEIERFYKWIIAGLFLIIISFLCLCNAASTSHLIMWEHTICTKDSVIFHIFLIAITIFAISAFKKSKINQGLREYLSDEKEFKRVKNIILCMIFALSAIWALSTQFVPGVDEYNIQSIVREVLQGNLSSFKDHAYMDIYPQQWGFFLFSLLIAVVFGSMNYIIIELLIAFAISMIFKQLSEIAKLLGAERTEQLFILIFGILFFPFLLYSEDVYGNMFGVAFALSAVKYEIIFFGNGNKKDAIKCGIAIALGMLMKSNMQIYFLAILFSSLVNIIKKKREAVFLTIVICLACFIESKGVEILVRILCGGGGRGLNAPITPLAWVAMGLQNDGEIGPGWWNSYITNSYYDCGGDIVKHAQVCMESIINSLSGFISNPTSGIKFFAEKILTTWTNPTFQCYGTVRNGSYVETPLWAQVLLSYKGQHLASKYLNVLSFLVFFGALLYILNRKDEDNAALILPMTFIGGFVFYIFWETKARYALMFFVVLIPLAARGYSLALASLEIRSKKRSKNAKRLSNIMKLRLALVGLVMVGFIALYEGELKDMLSQGSYIYKEYIANSGWREVTEYIEKQ